MNEIVRLEEYEDLEMYNPVLVLSEDRYCDNRCCILNTEVGNIGFSYHDLGLAPSAVIHDKILFLSFGDSWNVIDLVTNKILCQSDNGCNIIYEIIKCTEKSCILFVGELRLLCFSLEGQLIWDSLLPDIVYDWTIEEEGVSVVFENGEKWLVLFKDGHAYC